MQTYVQHVGSAPPPPPLPKQTQLSLLTGDLTCWKSSDSHSQRETGPRSHLVLSVSCSSASIETRGGALTAPDLITSERSCKTRQSCRGREGGRGVRGGKEIEWRPLEDPAQPIFISLIYVAKRWQLQAGLIQFLPAGLLPQNSGTGEGLRAGGGGGGGTRAQT